MLIVPSLQLAPPLPPQKPSLNPPLLKKHLHGPFVTSGSNPLISRQAEYGLFLLSQTEYNKEKIEIRMWAG
jgi:hypothetical protein